MTMKPLNNSHRLPVPGFHGTRSANPDEVVEITLVLKRTDTLSDNEIFKAR
jgi:hypothetical protein